MIVKINLWRDWEKLFLERAWWDHVIDTPDDNKMIVFNKGILNWLNGVTLLGGHLKPSVVSGESLEWKKAQKKERKKKISEVINKIIPHFMFLETLKEWHPWNVLSRIISRHHWIVVKIIRVSPIIDRRKEWKWNHSIKPIVKNNDAKALKIGHGLILTKWKGWFCVNIN